MNKKGQFFLIATFIVISLFLSLTLVYNSASMTTKNSDIDSVAENLKYEGIQIINNGYYNHLEPSAIRDNLRQFSSYTSKSFKLYDFTIVAVEDAGTNGNVYSYKDGVETDKSTNMALSSGEVTLNLNSYEYKFKLNKGYNFFVIVTDEKQNERYVASA